MHSLTFLGFQPYYKIQTIIEESNICVFPSLWENFPNVCLEAMCAGRAVIGTNNGGMADIITDKVNGMLIPPHSPNGIFNAVTTLLNDPAFMVKIGEAARQTVLNRYNADAIGKLTEDFYIKTINGNV